MADKKVFNPYEMVNFDLDYFEILGIDRESFPEGKTKLEREQIADICQKAYRCGAMKSHPDRQGGSEAAFKTLILAHTIISDHHLRAFYLTNGAYKPTMAEDSHIEVEWESMGTYRKGSLADTTLFDLFLNICEMKGKLGLIPGFIPKTEFDNYETDFVIGNMKDDEDRQYKLALSLVHDENDVLRLTSGEQVSTSLPFKIYMCIPRANLFFLRGEEEIFEYEDGSKDILNGKLQAASYSDYNLLETTSLEETKEYINNKLFDDLSKFRSGELIEEQMLKDAEAKQVAFVTKEKMNNMDIDLLKAILRMKSSELTINAVPDPNADKFVDRMPDNKKKKMKSS